MNDHALVADLYGKPGSYAPTHVTLTHPHSNQPRRSEYQDAWTESGGSSYGTKVKQSPAISLHEPI